MANGFSKVSDVIACLLIQDTLSAEIPERIGWCSHYSPCCACSKETEHGIDELLSCPVKLTSSFVLLKHYWIALPSDDLSELWLSAGVEDSRRYVSVHIGKRVGNVLQIMRQCQIEEAEPCRMWWSRHSTSHVRRCPGVRRARNYLGIQEAQSHRQTADIHE